MLLNGVIRSLPPLGSMTTLVALILFVYGMFGWTLFGEENRGTGARSAPRCSPAS